MNKQAGTLAIPFDVAGPQVRNAAHALGLTVLEPESGLQVVLEYGVFTISGSTSGCDLLLRADNEARLHDLRDTLNLYFENSGLREHLNWAADRTGTRPANLTIAHIENVRRISPSFFRVRLDGDFRRFEKDGLHFRLLFGPEGADWAHGGRHGFDHLARRDRCVAPAALHGAGNRSGVQMDRHGYLHPRGGPGN